ncbi:hypothetical protein CY34DRAFT_18316 [Suillus luteus UH-Slu-Lm8-n1]|uniref:DUF6534 domain-containing protein n=1 Tax=Suillus luteus UH-Slu-Lm8-n1 TaxID=930992 RepID=A0A0D0ANE1_9AGAM|nr:hypothetical protein CY34DRAFT_18316 [Suillus luteus UH-Slu-Lm8-n1]
MPQVDLGNTFGALFIGVALSAVLFGLTNVQIFIYFQTHRDTKMTFFELIVIWLWILDALHLALTIHCIYYYLVTNYTNFNALTEIVWSVNLQVVFEFLIIHAVHFSYAYRIWIVSRGRSRVLPTVIIPYQQMSISILVVFVEYQCHTFQDMIAIEWTAYLALSSMAFGDILIVSSLCYLLATSRTGFSSTGSFITKLMGYIISTGCLTSACSMIAVITCVVMPKNFIFLGLEFLVTKLYVNSFMALMNARYYLQTNAVSVGPPELHVHQDVYRPKLRINRSQDDKLQMDVSDDAVLHTTQPIQAIMVGTDGGDNGNAFFLVGVIGY